MQPPHLIPTLDVLAIRQQFPVIRREFTGRPSVYFDSAATYLKPLAVIDAVSECYRSQACTIGRGVHVMAEAASAEYEQARQSIADFINAEADEIVLVRNATEAINLIARSLNADTPVVGFVGEHHSNYLPWRRLHEFHTVAMLADGRVDFDDLREKIDAIRPRITTLSTVSNALGTVHNVEHWIAMSHAAGCDVLIDASQSVAHVALDVRALDCEYLCFSGHKLGGPTGVGVLYAKRDRLQRLRPMVLGGGTVNSVTKAGYELADVPMRLEAGTPAYEAAVGLAAACEFTTQVGLAAISAHEQKLVERLLAGLEENPRLAVLGTVDPRRRGSIVAFQVRGLEAHGVARLLSNRGNICVRSGFHCAQPAHDVHGWRPCVRVSFGMYNTSEEVQVFLDTLNAITVNL